MNDSSAGDNDQREPKAENTVEPAKKTSGRLRATQKKGADTGPLKKRTQGQTTPHKGFTTVDVWQIIGVLVGVVAATATVTAFVTSKLDTDIRTASKEEFWKRADENDIKLESALQHYLGETRGDIVYRGLVRRFEDPKIIPSQKQSMKYYITVSEMPPPNSSFADTLSNGGYYFLESELNFTKVEAAPLDEVIIAAVTEPNELAKWVRKKSVIFREVVDINEKDQDWFRNLLDRMNQAPTPQDRLKLSSQIFSVYFKMNGIKVDPVDIRREAFGLSLVYKAPTGINWEKPVQFEFKYFFVQPRKLTSFPIVIAEPTQNLDVRFDYSRATLRNLNYFRAFFVGDEENPRVDLDRRTSILQVKSIKEDEWIFPGGGVMIYWSQE